MKRCKMNLKDMPISELIIAAEEAMQDIQHLNTKEVIDRLEEYRQIVSELERRGYECYIRFHAYEEKNYPKCPHCGAELPGLENVRECEVGWMFNADGSYGELPDIIRETGRVNKWVCPYCKETIADNEEDALAFLNQKTSDN